MIRFLLTLVLVLSATAALAADPAPAPQQETAAPEEKLPGNYIGYSWPWADKDFAAELGSGPIVVELFSTQACIFCPVADRFFNDMIEKVPGVIGLSCHINYLDVKRGSLSQKACTDRQHKYVQNIRGSSVFTPQLVVNGRKLTFGFSYAKVYALLKDQAKFTPQTIMLKKEAGDQYKLTLPQIELPKDKPAELIVVQYLGPTERYIEEGPNRDIDLVYKRVVSSLAKQAWDGKTSVDIPVKPDANASGIVVLLQNKERILAVGEAKF